MALVEFELDPNAASYTDDEIVGKVNAASANITRAGAVEAAARPLEAGEAKTNLDAMADLARGYIKTSPQAGEFPVVFLQKKATGTLGITADDVAI